MIIPLILSLVQDRFQPVSDWKPCEVSTYSRRFDGRTTASGEIYRHDTGLTTATVRARNSTRPRIPFGTYVELKSEAGNSVIVKVNDTGSYRPRGVEQWFDLNGNSWNQLFPDIHPSRFTIKYRLVEKIQD